jgi:hypothetical protein
VKESGLCGSLEPSSTRGTSRIAAQAALPFGFASGSYLLVDDVFRQVVEDHKLKGLKFIAIPRVDAPR